MCLSILVCCSPQFFFFFFNDTATTEIYTLSLHDALPILTADNWLAHHNLGMALAKRGDIDSAAHEFAAAIRLRPGDRKSTRLNSSHSQISYAVFCLKKKKKTTIEDSFTLRIVTTPHRRAR